MEVAEVAMEGAPELRIACHHGRLHEGSEKFRHKCPCSSVSEDLVELAKDRFQKVGSFLVVHDALEDVDDFGEGVQDCVARNGLQGDLQSSSQYSPCGTRRSGRTL